MVSKKYDFTRAKKDYFLERMEKSGIMMLAEHQFLNPAVSQA